ncbi:MAG: hypothetical protein JSW58_02975 [Candidatus Latescibacterota bacterium]|nr:MAG: hypothetical protein JSW58_02975 [Candidatus Latescibacterota bacterium]
MRYRIVQRIVLILALCSLAGFLGCAAPKPCTVTPIDIEELKSDIRDLDAQLETANERLAQVQADLAGWEKRLAERRAEIPALEAELVRLRKASGVTERPEEEEPAEQSAAGL